MIYVMALACGGIGQLVLPFLPLAVGQPKGAIMFPKNGVPESKALTLVPKGAKNGASLEVMATCALLPEMDGYDELFVTSIGFQFLFWSSCMTMFTGQTGLGEGLINERWNLKFQAANTSSTRGGGSSVIQ